MLRWLLLAAISWGLVVGVQKGWLELRFDRMLHDLRVPFAPAPSPACGEPV
jgi:hypothetical protein